MKKLLVFVLFLSCFSIKISASSWRFVWEEQSTIVEIPLGGNLQNYTSIPKAYLYRDGQVLEDAQIQYVTTGDWLYLLTDVDTQTVGNYQVWYKAVETKYKPGQCQGYKTLVTFRVVDKEAPIFQKYPKTITYWIGSEKPKYLEQIIAIDNSKTCEISIDDSLVNYQEPGNYKVIIRAIDKSNITEQEIDLIVKDPIGPVITFLGENNRILLTKGEEVSIQKYFKAIDKIDGDVTDTISYPSFSTDEERSFELEVTFTDKNLNSSQIKIFIEIVDKDEVLIELYQKQLLLEYNQDFKKAIEENIKSAFLGKRNIKDEIHIDMSKVKNEVGSYIVSYSYFHNQREVNVECEVKMLSNTAPILLVENIITSVNEKPQIISYITVKDSSDSEIQSKLEWDDSLVDYSKAGTYPVRVSVTNSSGLSSFETLYITVCKDSLDKDEGEGDFFMILILIGGVAVLIGIGGFLYFKKKRNCNKEQNQL
ncbi:MAG: PKD domain-containing protein [Anaeroplasmataceae bacterium]|nr:PKD domain-containing protein [Anaeroplasmataceae bacterium]